MHVCIFYCLYPFIWYLSLCVRVVKSYFVICCMPHFKCILSYYSTSAKVTFQSDFQFAQVAVVAVRPCLFGADAWELTDAMASPPSVSVRLLHING
jgi:hypothetical protein